MWGMYSGQVVIAVIMKFTGFYCNLYVILTFGYTIGMGIDVISVFII